MADTKRPNFEQIEHQADGSKEHEAVEPVIESGKEKELFDPEGDRKVAELVEKLKKPVAEFLAPSRTKAVASLDERIKMQADKYFQKMMAAQDNYEEIMDVIREAANKYLDKYPGIVDDIHDRWLDERNKGMY